VGVRRDHCARRKAYLDDHKCAPPKSSGVMLCVMSRMGR
jgi:hypothetical protein